MYLNCHTWYSLHYGTFSEEELCRLAVASGVRDIAVTDINSSTACLRFYKTALQYNLNPLIGIDFRNGNEQMYIGITKTLTGYRELNTFLSKHLHHKRNFPKDAPELKDCYIIYPFEQVRKHQRTQFKPHEFIGISVADLPRLKFSSYKKYSDKLIFQQPVSFRNKRDYNAHRLLRAIGLNTLLSKLPKSEQGKGTDRMYPLSEIQILFKDFECILENTKQLIANCRVAFEIGPGLNKNLQVFGNSKKEDENRLRRLCKERFKTRYPHPNREVLKRVAKELQTITDLGFVSYFLINLDIIEYAKSKNYSYIGRGSGANSVVAYILGITNVDPIELNLYFERFINPNRSSPPDFDIDFSWKDRDDVIRYIFERYEHTALMGTYVTFKRRAVIRELGKVFGLPKRNIDKLVAGRFQPHELDSFEKLVFRYSSYIEGFPNYLSVHSGGILILNESVYNFTATFLPPKNFRTLQIDMYIAEEAGLHKFDILAQRGLPKITDAIEIIKQNQPNAKIEDIENITVFKNDPKVNHLLKTGDCMGVFYVESPAMRSLLIQLQTDNYLNLVAASSIIRPGISGGGMKTEYIKRHRQPEKRKEAHPILYEIMPDTYGIMVYQEDVMKVAHYFAGLDLDDADVLRRGMSGKKTQKDQIIRIEQKFRENCLNKGYDPKLIDEVWTQIASFAGYAFPKGHSASYAVESYQSLYLKCYFPLEFMVAVINNGGGFYTMETYLQEIRNCGGTVHAPDINKSDFAASIDGKDIYLGFGHLKNIEHNTCRRILENRNFFGAFLSLADFMERVPISIEQISILINIEAFRFTGKNKYELLWESFFILQKSAHQNHQKRLFHTKSREFQFPEFHSSQLSRIYTQLELLGFHLYHPFSLLKNNITGRLTAKDLKHYVGKSIVIYGTLITFRTIKTKSGKPMYFGTFYDYQFGIFDTVHFPDSVKNYPVYGNGIYRCTGKVVEEFDSFALEIKTIIRMEIKNPVENYEPYKLQ